MTATIPPPSQSLANLFFGTYRSRVLSLLLLHPEESLHIREIARLTGTQPGTLRRELAQLAEAGVLTAEPLGNLVRYRANRACPIYGELREIFRKTTGLADVLREALAPLAPGITAAFVYGSVAAGEEQARSDIDLMIVGSLSFEAAAGALSTCEPQLRREVNAVVFRPDEFRAKRLEGNPFLDRVMQGARLFVMGGEHDLSESPTAG